MNMFSNVPHHIETIAERSVPVVERELTGDDKSALIRKCIIGIHTYGKDDSRLPSFLGLSKAQTKELVEREEVQQSISNGEVICWTKAEIIARLAVEADRAPKASERILALTKLMEYRGLAAPEGGARGFERIIQRFNKPQAHQCKDLTQKLTG